MESDIEIEGIANIWGRESKRVEFNLLRTFKYNFPKGHQRLRTRNTYAVFKEWGTRVGFAEVEFILESMEREMGA